MKTTGFLYMLNDLVMVQDERTSLYRKGLACLTTIDKNLRVEFDKIISDGEDFKQQLLDKLCQLNISNGTGSMIYGNIYTAWKELKGTFSGKTQKAIIAYILYNDEIVLSLYDAVLTNSAGMELETRELIMKQERELRTINNEIREYNKPFYSIESEYASQGGFLSFKY